MFNNIKGVGPKKATLLNNMGIYNQSELINLFPNDYEDKRNVSILTEDTGDRKALYRLCIKSKTKPIRTAKGTLTSVKAFDESDKCEIIYFNDIYSPRKLELDVYYYFYGKVVRNGNLKTIYNPEVSTEKNFEFGLVPIYPLTKGLFQNELRKFIEQALKITNVREFLSEDLLFLRGLIKLNEAYKMIHSPKNYEDIVNSKKRFVYQELFLLILSLNYIREMNVLSNSAPINTNKEKVIDFIDSLEFTLTLDQKKVVDEILEDMSSSKPMNRLLQGDVGSGKTIVAILAAIYCVNNGYQCAFIAPTEVLANQHYYNYCEKLKTIGIKSSVLTGSISERDKKSLKSMIEDGDIDIVFGTHALIQEDVSFKKLGLVITDEQHRFGVKQRDNLISKGDNPHVLVMSATPIPRTLALTIYGDLDLSTINVLPSGRLPIQTFAVNMSYEKRVFSFIKKEIQSNKQVYIVCPTIDDNELNLKSVYDIRERLIQYGLDEHSEVLHGKLPKQEQQEIVDSFKDKKISILISTTVIEVGIDIPNASTIVIYNAERFGLAQLHQLRGRVGRGRHQSYCILICTSNSKSARERMKVLETSNDGFIIADKDLELRGPGEILGYFQHGSSILNDLDYNFKNILEWANKDAKRLIEKDPTLELEENSEIKNKINDVISKIIRTKSLN
ncbi:ATP-dependent DNA helicase RecG [Microaceticoccus formicicus]|uniref:ATP-dependent DNA helicase RecG n=1 Tax=Microaceticoccus formicicus TaxID=3118105 RepID=UPI003CD028B7|nr:ATP-dependent DNA helicase RecG [Peptoniphilaceae bacterium AMB_02]